MHHDETTSAFMEAARALSLGMKNGYVNIGNEPPRRKLTFPMVENGQKVLYSATEQNPELGSQGAMLQKAGHKVVVIKNLTTNRLVGFADITDDVFFPYTGPQGVVDLEDIRAFLKKNDPQFMSEEKAEELLEISASTAEPQPTDEDSSKMLKDAEDLVKRLKERLGMTA